MLTTLCPNPRMGSTIQYNPRMGSTIQHASVAQPRCRDQHGTNTRTISNVHRRGTQNPQRLKASANLLLRHVPVSGPPVTTTLHYTPPAIGGVVFIRLSFLRVEDTLALIAKINEAVFGGGRIAGGA